MSDLTSILTRLGLDHYIDAFIVEGFDTWETLLDIQEGDLDALNVKLGHRRKLQREIARQRNLYYDQPVGSVSVERSLEPTISNENLNVSASNERPGPEKRKYRRHAKPDKNAPSKPSSAYVLFSSEVREEVRDQNLSFTDIAKLVGDRWQKLSPDGKEPFESRASAAKEKYNSDLASYKKTDAYREYEEYLADFKAKLAQAGSEQKRPKIESDSSGDPFLGRRVDMEDNRLPGPTHDRNASIGSITTAFSSTLHSPGSLFNPAVRPAPMGSTSNDFSTISSPPSATSCNSPPSGYQYPESRLPSMVAMPMNGLPHDQLPRADAPELPSPASQISMVSRTGSLGRGSIDSSSTQPAPLPPAFQYREQSSTAASGRNDMPSATSFISSTTSSEPWGFQASETKGRPPQWPSSFNNNPHTPPYPSNIGPTQYGGASIDRLSDYPRDFAQRTLPLPTLTSPQDNRSSFRGLLQPSHPLRPLEPPVRDPSQAVENPESDAASTLAVLASRGR